MNQKQLLYAIVAARSNAEVRNVLGEYAQATDYGTTPEDLPFRCYGDRESNDSSFENMGSTANALYEKLTNGHDACIELLQSTSFFQSNPQNASQALAEIGERQRAGERIPTVFMTVARANTPSTGGRPQKKTNVMVIDEGVGITAERMPDTILSLNKSNKLKNKLMSGHYGHGGAAIHRFSQFGLVISRSAAEPNTLGFTIVLKKHLSPEDTWMSYGYIVDDENGVLTVDVADLDPGMLCMTEDFFSFTDNQEGREQIIQATESKLILPPQGTLIKVWDLIEDSFKNGNAAYNFLRDRGFAMPANTELRVALPTDDATDPTGGQKRVYHMRGLRNSLAEPDARRGGRDSFETLVNMHRRGEVLEGKADVRVWVLDRRDWQKNTDNRSPVETKTGLKDRKTKAIYITTNSHTHDNRAIGWLLNQADLEQLSGHIMIEVDCDNLSAREKGNFFNSGREGTTNQGWDLLNADLRRFLTSEAQDPVSPVYAAKRKLAERDMQRAVDRQSKGMVETFSRILRSPLFGSVFSSFGATAPTENLAKEGAIGSGQGSVTLGPRQGAGVSPETEIPLRPVPDLLASHSIKTFEEGSKEYIRVQCNGVNSWADKVSISLPVFLKLINSPTLDRGRVLYLVECIGTVGNSGEVYVGVDRSSVDKEDLLTTVKVEVIKRQRKDPTSAKEKSERKGLPSVRITPVEPEDHHIAPDNRDFEPAMSYVYDKAMGVVNVHFNRAYKPMLDAAEWVKKRFKSQAAYESLVRGIEDYAKALALSHIQGGGEKDDTTKRGWADALRAQAIMLATSMDKNDFQTLEAEEALAA